MVKQEALLLTAILLHMYCREAARVESDDTVLSGVEFTPWERLVNVSRVVGEGAFGTVSLASLAGGCDGEVAIKELKTCKKMDVFQDEIYAMRQLNHPNIIRLYDVYPVNTTDWCNPVAPHIMMEPAYGGSMDKNMAAYRKGTEIASYLSRLGGFVLGGSQISKRRDMKMKLLMIMLVDTLRGLAFMHEKHFVHRDIKMDNLWEVSNSKSCLENLECHFIVGDLGLAYHYTSEGAPVAGTEIYLSPDVLRTRIYTFKSDVWALSTTLMQIYCGWSVDKLVGAFVKANPDLESEIGFDDLPGAVSVDMTPVMKRKSYLPPDLLQLLVDMNEANISVRPSSAEALSRAEAIFMKRYGKQKAQRSNDPPACIKRCKNLGCTGMDNCKLSGGEMKCEARGQPVRMVITTESKSKFEKGWTGKVVGEYGEGQGYYVVFEGHGDTPIKVSTNYVETWFAEP